MGCGRSNSNTTTISKHPSPPTNDHTIKSRLNPISNLSSNTDEDIKLTVKSLEEKCKDVKIEAELDAVVSFNTNSKLNSLQGTNKETAKHSEEHNKEVPDTKPKVSTDVTTKSKLNPTKDTKEFTAKHSEEQTNGVADNNAMIYAHVSPTGSNFPLIPPAMNSGFMSRQGSVFRKWQQRYFILEKGELRYYEDDASLRMVGQPLNLRGYVVTEMEGDELLIYIPGRKSSISDDFPLSACSEDNSEQDTARQLHVKIGSKEERLKWEKSLKEHIDYMNCSL